MACNLLSLLVLANQESFHLLWMVTHKDLQTTGVQHLVQWASLGTIVPLYNVERQAGSDFTTTLLSGLPAPTGAASPGSNESGSSSELEVGSCVIAASH